MKTLYVSDLDGTLLRSNEKTSDYTNDVINKLTEQGMIFSYATARSFVTAKKVAEGIQVSLPLIIYNGAFILDNMTNKMLMANYFDSDIHAVMEKLFENDIYPLVYSYIDNIEKFSYIPEKCTRGMKEFLDARKGDLRHRPVNTVEELLIGDKFYLSCIDEPEKLKPLYEKYKDQYHLIYQRDIYSKEQWLELLPKAASKANAALQLKELLQCDKLVVFGDGKNDIDMFQAADECYAVENAVDELKQIATDIIDGNNEDGVAKWLEKNAGYQKK